MSNAPRNTTIRDQHRNAIKRTKPPCGICEGEINYSLPHLDPMSYVVDHILPVARGGIDSLENKAASHRDCNRAKSDRLPSEAAKATSRAQLIESSDIW